MNMLYKIAEGAVKETHYGLALARLVPLPPVVVDHAIRVAKKLERQSLKSKKRSATVIRERRRKLILNLKEHLIQAQSGVMEGEVLTDWLKELQKEFVSRMTAIDAEAAKLEEETESGDEETEEDEDEDEIMRDEASESAYGYNENNQNNEINDYDEDETMEDEEMPNVKMESLSDVSLARSSREPSVITITTGTETTTETTTESRNGTPSTMRAVSENER